MVKSRARAKDACHGYHEQIRTISGENPSPGIAWGWSRASHRISYGISYRISYRISYGISYGISYRFRSLGGWSRAGYMVSVRIRVRNRVRVSVICNQG